MFDNCWALVVEDDAHSLIAITSLLNDLGIRYKRNTTGSAVAESALAMKPRPAFILLDLDLPHGDPFEIVKSVTANPVLASIPVIALANDNGTGLLPVTRKAGFAAFLLKPLPRRALGRLLQRILDGEQVWQTRETQFTS